MIAASVSSIALSFSLMAAQVSESHRPNAYTTECLQAPSQACALEAALKTVIDEELGLVRANVLTGVAQAQLALGQPAAALETLEISLEEARSANLALVVQERIRTIAPLMAAGGAVERATELAMNIRIASVRDGVLESIANIAADRGEAEQAFAAINEISNARRGKWRRLDVMLRLAGQGVKGLDAQDILPDLRASGQAYDLYRGLFTAGLLAQLAGDAVASESLMQEAGALYDTILSASVLADMASLRLRAVHISGVNSTLLEASYNNAVELSKRLRGTDRTQFAARVGPIEAATGRMDAALARLDDFTGISEKGKYLATLEPSSPSAELSAAAQALTGDLTQFESAYERDQFRFSLLAALINSGDAAAAIGLVRAVEDDDNQALALALIAPLL